MKIGSLFAGVGGFDIAAEWCGWETAWYAENDPYASSVMAENYPNAVNHGDVTKIDGRAVEPVDLLCGGFPCQDISLAGKGAGLAGARSGLWKEYLRLIEEIRPRWVVIENVAALRTRGLEQVLRDLDALLYVGEGHCIPASAVGANHRRDRIWIVAYSLSHALRECPERHQQYTALGWDSLFGDDGAAEPLADAGLEPLDRLHGEGGAERGGAAAPEGAVDAHEPGRRGDHARETDVADALGELGRVERDRPDAFGEWRWAARDESGGRGEAVADALGAGLEGHAGDGEGGAGWPGPDRSARAEGVCGGVPDADGAGCALVLEGEEGSQVERGDGWGYASGARGLAGCPTAEWWAVEPDIRRVAHGVPVRVDRLKCLGNAIVPQVAYVLFRAIDAREREWAAERELAGAD